MDWIHCNNCCSQLTPTVTLYLTTCGHMYCNNCLGNDKKNGNCVICRSTCSMIKLEPDMSPDVQDYFTDPEELIKKVCQVLQFQKQHRKRLLSYLLQSSKKFYQARTELKKMSELAQKQHAKLKLYEKKIGYLESKLENDNKQGSPFLMPISPVHCTPPNYIQCTPTVKKPAKSTPYTIYQSSLVTPSRVTKQRMNNYNSQSQMSNHSNKISSTVLSPSTPDSAGYEKIKSESGYSSSSSCSQKSGFVYCNGYGRKCPLSKHNGPVDCDFNNNFF